MIMLERQKNLGCCEEEVSNYWTDVTAVYGSAILGRSAPIAPVRVDAMAGALWAQEILIRNALAHLQPKLPDELLLFMLRAKTFWADTWTGACLWVKRTLDMAQIMLSETRWLTAYLLRNICRISLDMDRLGRLDLAGNQIQKNRFPGCAMQKLFAFMQNRGCTSRACSIGNETIGASWGWVNSGEANRLEGVK